MLPLSLIRAAKGSPVLVEVKSGETYNGLLVSTDAYMNLTVSDVICTAASGDRFWKLPSANIRGSAIKYLRLPDSCLDAAEKLDEQQQQERNSSSGWSRGGSDGGRGGGRGRHANYNNSNAEYQPRGGSGRGRRGGGRYSSGSDGRDGGRGGRDGGRGGRGRSSYSGGNRSAGYSGGGRNPSSGRAQPQS